MDQLSDEITLALQKHAATLQEHLESLFLGSNKELQYHIAQVYTKNDNINYIIYILLLFMCTYCSDVASPSCWCCLLVLLFGVVVDAVRLATKYNIILVGSRFCSPRAS